MATRKNKSRPDLGKSYGVVLFIFYKLMGQSPSVYECLENKKDRIGVF